MSRALWAVLALLCAPAAPSSAELTVNPPYADVRGGQPLVLTLATGTHWQLEQPHCLIGTPAALTRVCSAAAMPPYGVRTASCALYAPVAQGGLHRGAPLRHQLPCRQLPTVWHQRRPHGKATTCGAHTCGAHGKGNALVVPTSATCQAW